MTVDDAQRRTSNMTRLMRADLMERCRASDTVLPPGYALSHLTASWIHGLPLSYAMEEDTRLHLIRPIRLGQTRTEGHVGHRAVHQREILEVEGLPVVGLADTWVDLGELVGRGKPVGVDDLIVIGDSCAAALGSVMPLRAALAKRIRPRGKVALLEALELIRVGSRSAGETLARCMFVRCGLPEPFLNEAIISTQDPTQLLGVPDMGWRIIGGDGEEIKVAGEYQGREFHEGTLERARDAQRRRAFEDDGWIVENIWDEDMATGDARRKTVRRFAAALRVPLAKLDLSEAEPHFFSRHAIRLAIQRQARRRP